MQRFGAPRRSDISYTRRPGAYAVLVRGGQMLMTFQAEPEPEFQLPGGGIDAGETPVQALHREVYEETGWTISTPRRIGTYKRFVYMPDYDLWAEKICMIYLARPIRPLGPPTEESHTAIWVPLSAAPAIMDNEGDRAFVQQVIDRL